MRFFRRLTSYVICAALLFAVLPMAREVHAQDMVESTSLTGGGSAFVFRGSRKSPQSGAGFAYASSGEGARLAGSARRTRTDAQIAAAEKRRKLAAIAARKKAMAAAANRKLRLSNTLTAKAEASLEKDEFDPAIKDFRAALVQNPKNSRAATGLSDALTGKGIIAAGSTNDITAAGYFEEAIKYDKNNDVAYAKLGAIYDAAGQKEKAVANYEHAVAIDPAASDLQATLGLAYVESGEIAKAENALQHTAGSDSEDIRLLRALILYKQNKNAEAIAAFDNVLELDQRNALVYFYRGQAFARIPQEDKAISSYNKALEIDPHYAAAAFDLGVLYYNQGRYADAERAYKAAIAADGNNYQAHANLAATYRQMERYPDAVAEYEIAAQGIRSAELYSEWGYCLGKTGQWNDSVAKLETARGIDPSAVQNSNLGWAYYNSGQAKAAAKDNDGAKADYEKSKAYSEQAKEQDPKLSAPYLNMGSTYNALGEFQAAVHILNSGLGLNSNWGLALNQLGVGYRGLNDLNNAISTFKRVVDMNGNDRFGLYNLGEAYFASGNKKEAKRINDRLRKIDPTLAGALNDVFEGRIPALGNIPLTPRVNVPRVPKVPRLPRFP